MGKDEAKGNLDGGPASGLAHPAVAEILAGVVAAPEGGPGVCVWLTGIPCSGKSTTAEALAAALEGRGRQVTVLDGDIIRTHISRDLGFSKADRDANIRRVGGVAAAIVERGGIVICAVVSPYAAARQAARETVGTGHFVEVFVDTPPAVAAARDVRGYYAQARRGELTGFTGVDDPYERPQRPELTLDTVGHTVGANIERIIGWLEEGRRL